MTLEEAIKHAEKVTEEQETLANTYKSFKDYGDLRSSITSQYEKCKNWADEHRQLAEWLKELKQYKEKDTPKLVIYSGDGYVDGHMVYDWAECPNCSSTFEEGDDAWETKYCPDCGQALKWEEEE